MSNLQFYNPYERYVFVVATSCSYFSLRQFIRRENPREFTRRYSQLPYLAYRQTEVDETMFV